MDEESIEEVINKEAIELESILNVKLKMENELEERRTEKCLSVMKLDKEDIPNHFPCRPRKHGTTREEDADTTEEIYWSEEEEEEEKGKLQHLHLQGVEASAPR